MSNSEKTVSERELAIEKSIMKVVRKIKDPNKKTLAIPLVKRIAFLLVQLEDLEENIKINGWVESFQQSDKVEPFEKKRATVEVFFSVHSSYIKSLKELNGLMKEEDSNVPERQNDLISFMKGK